MFALYREKVYQAKLYCESYMKNTGMRLDMRPYACGNICGVCDLFGCPTVSDCLTTPMAIVMLLCYTLQIIIYKQYYYYYYWLEFGYLQCSDLNFFLKS